MPESLEFRNAEFNSCWIGDRLLPIANACINSFKAHGFEFNLYTYDLVSDVPDFVASRDAEGLLSRNELFIAHGGVETSADLFAYRFLERLGGWVVDSDVVCNTDQVPDVEIAFAEEREGIINNAVLKFPRNHPAIIDLLAYVATVDPVNSVWGSTGPLALSKILGCHRDLARFTLEMSAIYPLHWTEAPKLLFPEFTNEITEKTADSKFIHLWGATLREINFDLRHSMPLEGSYLDILYAKYLDPRIAAELRPLNEHEFRNSVKQYVEHNWNVLLPLV